MINSNLNINKVYKGGGLDPIFSAVQGISSSFRFNNNTVDSAGGSSASLVGGPTYVPDTWSGNPLGAVNIPNNGGNQYITIPHQAKFSYTNGSGVDQPFSWVLGINKTVDSAGDPNRILHKNQCYQIDYERSPNTIRVRLRDAALGGNNLEKRATGFTYSNGPIILTVTYDGSGYNGLKIYRYKTESSSYTDLSIGTYNGMGVYTTPLYLGQIVGGSSGTKLRGDFNFFHAWNRVLSQEDIDVIIDYIVAGNELPIP